ncbi:hypothetical protein [Porphyrobacter sp. YT40]|uniref:hypothetical protein n=1 Tax=Porphyrobacter sp. YT40 TaxID=2547601 RepID=UPI00114339E0|nr:hypothetical protein [Porphyrobacter sp. YT40]QDH35317.1 hypothetical protein E2E27_13915 [Porphyrobacter sp. YT40]
MSATDPDPGAPIVPGSPLARKLDAFAAPGLSAGFADRVLAAAESRAAPDLAPLPPLRRVPPRRRGWRVGQRVVIGLVGFTALASAAAATGLLERFDIPVPSAEKVWASLTGQPAKVAAAPVAPPPVPAAQADGPAALASTQIVGPIDTPEELSEAFRRIDAVREGRFAERQARIDQRIDAEIERRRAAGLRVPTPEEEARLRERIDDAQARRKQRMDEAVAARREELARKVENGEPLTRQDVVQPLREDAEARQRLQRLRELRSLSPEDRREALRRLPPAERRALIEEFRARRAEAVAAPSPTPSAETSPAPAPPE